MAFNEPCFNRVRNDRDNQWESTLDRYIPYPYMDIIEKIGYRIENADDFNNIRVFDRKTNEELRLVKNEKYTLFFEANDGRTVDILASGYIVLSYNDRIKIAVKDISSAGDRIADIMIRVVSGDSVSVYRFHTRHYLYSNIFETNISMGTENDFRVHYNIYQKEYDADVNRTRPQKIVNGFCEVKKYGHYKYCTYEDIMSVFNRIMADELKKDKTFKEVSPFFAYCLEKYARENFNHYIDRMKGKFDERIEELTTKREELTSKYMDDMAELSDDLSIINRIMNPKEQERKIL